ncbi:hypothetical protein COO09_24510 [Rhizorhabdus dicambivorans]|uniref:Uncharacterized protein n=1 Tax=Rhizorhabdus dicambivorans TaxID=1850238 RepID=A0A2A4FPI7_9SPHN|nr:hypothetical protein CMV14_20460 [Rhizorhabdus dicambivorans]PCE39634.1 hypothetical protein COO09_24510 [Rhizorhabdus dicambivorans]
MSFDVDGALDRMGAKGCRAAFFQVVGSSSLLLAGERAAGFRIRSGMTKEGVAAPDRKAGEERLSSASVRARTVPFSGCMGLSTRFFIFSAGPISGSRAFAAVMRRRAASGSSRAASL